MTASTTKQAPHGTQRLFTVEGRIEQLRKAPGTVNLLEDIQKRILVPGVTAALSGQAGMLANAASLALYDGEDIEHFAFLINGQLAVGTFEWIDDIHNGDDVKLVVSDERGVLRVHALLRKADQLLWMPYSVDRSRWGWVIHATKLCGLVLILTWLMFGAFIWIDGELPEPMGLYILLGGLPLILLLVGFMSVQGMLPLGERAEEIFKALGVPRPARFNLKKYALSQLSDLREYDPDRNKKGYIFKFADAIAVHTKGRNL